MVGIVSALELKVPPGVLVLLFAVAMRLSATLFPALAFALPGRGAVAAALFFAAAVVVAAGVIGFRRAGTTVNPMRPGAASRLVISGVYRRSRNPMYVAALLALAGWAAYLSHWLPLLFLPAFVAYLNRFQIAPEERALAARFGEEFAAYRGSVRRWL